MRYFKNKKTNEILKLDDVKDKEKIDEINLECDNWMELIFLDEH